MLQTEFFIYTSPNDISRQDKPWFNLRQHHNAFKTPYIYCSVTGWCYLMTQQLVQRYSKHTLSHLQTSSVATTQMPPLFLSSTIAKGTKDFTLRSQGMNGFYIGCTEEGYHKCDPTPRWIGIQYRGWKTLQISLQKSRSLALSHNHFARHTREQSQLVQPWP